MFLAPLMFSTMPYIIPKIAPTSRRYKTLICVNVANKMDDIKIIQENTLKWIFFDNLRAALKIRSATAA